MTLEEIRAQIDQIDPEIRDLLMKRLDCAAQVAEAKKESGDLTIYRADREKALLDRLGEGVPEDRKTVYLAVVRKIMETSRMYQYGLLFDRIDGLFDPLAENIPVMPDGNRIRLRVSRPDRPNSMSSILSMVGDYGYNMESMQQIEDSGEPSVPAMVSFELTIRGNLLDRNIQKLMYQLSMECSEFQILEQYRG